MKYQNKMLTTGEVDWDAFVLWLKTLLDQDEFVCKRCHKKPTECECKEKDV